MTSLIWRRDFIRTLLESDLPQRGLRVPAATPRRFWAMLAHFHGQIWNGAELGRSLGVSPSTCRRYLDLLEGVFMVRLLQIVDRDALLCHPRLGASWEGFVLEQILTAWQPDGAWFWATHGGAELDLRPSAPSLRPRVAS